MSRRIVEVPREVFRAADVTWDIDWRGQSGGSGNDGLSQLVFNRFPRWIGSPTLVLPGPMLDRWRALRLRVQGRAGVLRVPMVDRDTGPAWAAHVTCVGGASAGADTLMISAAPGALPRIGQILSHDDWPFAVTDVEVSASGATLQIEMPLRRAIPADAEIDLFAWGIFEMADPASGNPAAGLAQIARPEIALQEWIGRP